MGLRGGMREWGSGLKGRGIGGQGRRGTSRHRREGIRERRERGLRRGWGNGGTGGRALEVGKQ